MIDDPHAQANAEQVRVLREALTGQLAQQRPCEATAPDSNRKGQTPLQGRKPQGKTL